MEPATTTHMTRGREVLLEAALDVIADQGWGAVTVRAVAERADVSPGTVTYHFETADALLVAALEYGAGEASMMLEQLALDLQSRELSAEEWILAFSSALAKDLEEKRQNHLACFELQLLAARRPMLGEAALGIRIAYLRISRMALQAQGMSGPELDLASINLTALVTGLMLRELADNRPGAEQRFAEALGVAQV